MSFNINFDKPVIINAQASQDGGAGNLGYMKGGKEENKRHKESSNSIFDEQKDSFTKSGEEKKESFETYIERIILTFKLIFQRIFRRN